MLGLISLGVVIGVICGFFIGCYFTLENLVRSDKSCRACGRRWINPQGKRIESVKMVQRLDRMPEDSGE